MAEFQTVLGIILVITAVVIIAIAIYNLAILSKVPIDSQDSKSRVTDAEKKGSMATNVILIILALVIGVYGIIVLIPPSAPPPPAAVVVSQRTSRAII